MIEYLICLAFWVSFTFLIYALGNVIIKEECVQSLKFIAGYLLYSFTIALPGIFVQLINAPWFVFKIYVIILFMFLIAIIVYTKMKRGYIFNCTYKEYLMENFLLIITCLGLVCMLFFYFRMFWEGNHLDDGYYVTKVATLPYEEYGFRTNYAIGTYKPGIDTYVVNTWELEASVFVEMLNVHPTLFLRLFQSAFNYFLCLNCILAFSTVILRNVKGKVKLFEAQFVQGIMILLFMYDLFAEGTNIFFVSDMTQNNTAMYYGGSIVKIISIMLLLVFYLDQNKITLKMIFGVCIIATVLMSKSAVALPIIIIVSISYTIVVLFLNENRKCKFLGIGLLTCFVLLSIIIPGLEYNQVALYNLAEKTIKSYLFIVATLVFVLSFFLLKEKIIYKMNCIIILLAFFMFVPQVNDLFERFSVFGFVGGRTWDTLVYTYIVINIIYVYLMCRERVSRRIVGNVFVGLGIGAFCLQLFGYNMYGGDIYINENSPVEADVRGALKTIYYNPYFFPNGTIELSDKLELLSNETGEKLRVVSPEVVGLNGAYHTLSVQLRIYAPDLISVSAADRYAGEGEELYGYNQEVYEAFASNPNDETARDFEEMLKKYDVNCVIIANNNSNDYLERMGFKMYDYAAGYLSIWYKN